MKRILLTLSLAIFIANIAGAQKKTLNEASSALNNNELDKAWTAIELAKDNEETKILPKTWVVRGKIIQAIAKSTDPKYSSLVNDALFESYASYQKAIEVDEKKKVSKEIDLSMFEFIGISQTKGIEAFKTEKYDLSLKYFELGLKAYESPIFKGAIDTMTIFNAGLAALYGKNYDKSIEYYNKAIFYNYGGASSFSYLKDCYYGKGDTANALATIQKAFEKYPNDLTVIVDLVNYYINKGQTPEALSYLTKAKEKDPKNPSFYFAEGTLYEKMNNLEKAKEAYLKSTEVDPNYFNGYYNLGVMYFNKAAKIYEDANNTMDNQKYDELLKNGNETMKEALPYMKKAHELDPKEKSVLESLKSIYFRLSMTTELEEVKAKLEQLP
jgi:tetratricopeptide (TPR) repeat protein